MERETDSETEGKETKLDCDDFESIVIIKKKIGLSEVLKQP